MKNLSRKMCLIAFLASQSVFAAPTVFEDFSGAMSEQKFDGTEQTMDINSSGELVLSSRAKSFLPSIPRSNQLFLNDSGEISTFSADIKVTELSLGNSDSQQAILRMAGTFYLTEGGRAWVGINIGDRGNGLEAWYEISNDFYDDTGQYLSSVSVSQGSLALEGLSLNTAYPASITYDGNTGFTFTFNNGTPVTVSGPAKVADSFNWKGVGTRLRFGQNNATPDIYGDEIPDDGTTASISSTVDNVSTDVAGLGDDFSTANLDKWNRVPNSSMISADGQLEIAIAQTDSGSQTQRVSLNQQDLTYFGAKVTLSSMSTPSETARIRGRIIHYVGNDTYDVSNGDTPNGFEGNIFSQFVIERKVDGTFRAFLYISRATNADFSSEEEILFQEITPATPVAYDVQYDLAIEQVDKTVNFIIDGETAVSFNLTTSSVFSGNLYSATGSATSQLNARVQYGPGRVVALFDDVTTDLVPSTVLLNAANSDEEQVVLPEEVIVNVGELVTLIADASNPAEIIKYIWEQVGGTDVGIPAAGRGASSSAILAKVIGTENTLTFTIPDGSDTEDLAFKLTTVDKSGLESEELFTLAVDNSKASTLSPDINTDTVSSGGGGSFNFFFIFMLLLVFTAKLRPRSDT